MGYFGNHLATLVTGVFAAVLTGLWPYFTDLCTNSRFHISDGSPNNMVYDIHMLDFTKKY